jgi:hypothetical protein
MPVSAMRPANTETIAGVAGFERIGDRTHLVERKAVILSTTPSDDSARMSSLDDCPLVLVTGIFTLFGPRSQWCAPARPAGEVVGKDLEQDRPVADHGQHLAREGHEQFARPGRLTTR